LRIVLPVSLGESPVAHSPPSFFGRCRRKRGAERSSPFTRFTVGHPVRTCRILTFLTVMRASGGSTRRRREEHSSLHDSLCLTHPGCGPRESLFSPPTVKRVTGAGRNCRTFSTIGWQEGGIPLCATVPLPKVNQ